MAQTMLTVLTQIGDHVQSIAAQGIISIITKPRVGRYISPRSGG